MTQQFQFIQQGASASLATHLPTFCKCNLFLRHHYLLDSHEKLQYNKSKKDFSESSGSGHLCSAKKKKTTTHIYILFNCLVRSPSDFFNIMHGDRQASMISTLCLRISSFVCLSALSRMHLLFFEPPPALFFPSSF